MTHRGSLRGAVVASVVGIAAQGVARLATNVVVGRIAGVEALGHVSTISAVAFGAAVAGPTALGAASAKFVSAAHGRGSDAEAADLAVSLQARAYLLTGLLAVAAAVWGAVTADTATAMAAGLLTAGACSYAVARCMCFVEQRSALGMRVEAGAAIAAFAATALLAWAGIRGALLLVPQAVGLIGYAAVFSVPRWRWGRLGGEVSEFVLLGLLGNIASAGVLQFTVVAARLDAGPRESGLVSAAFAISTPLSFIAQAVTSATYPAIARAVGGGHASATRTAMNAHRALALLLVPVFTAVSLFSDVVLVAVWGDAFRGGEGMVPPMAAAILVTSVAAPIVGLLTASSRWGMRMSTLTSVAGTAVGVLVWLWALSVPGPQPVAIGYGYLLCLVLTALASAYLADRHSWGALGTLLASLVLVIGAGALVGVPLLWRIVALLVVAALVAGLAWCVRGRLTRLLRPSAPVSAPPADVSESIVMGEHLA